MGLILPQLVEIDVTNSVKTHFKNLGYEIPEYYDKRHNRWYTPKGTKIPVNVNDLKPNSNLIVNVECDICGRKEQIEMIEYTRLKSYASIYRYDYLCLDCKFDIIPTAKFNVGVCKDDSERIRQFLIKKLTNFIKLNGYPKHKKSDFTPNNKMPTLKMYEDYLDGDLVNWIELCGYCLTEDEKYQIRHRGGQNNVLSKAECIDIIMKMQNEFGRPLQYSDFKNPNKDTIGITIVKKYWGTLNKMKKELGLEIIQESMMDRVLNKDGLDNLIDDICKYVRNDNRDFITTREINQNSNWHNYGTLSRYSKKYYNVSFDSLLNIKGIHLGEQGNGINYDFEDGEHTTSQYEYLFSKFLKSQGLFYNKDYFRDVKYSSFIKTYKGNMNCDYIIHLDDKIIYIEIAGIIADYKLWYYDNKTITYSKSKEKYRLKLTEKEKMLKNNNLHYYLLFPCDLTIENFKSVLFDDSVNKMHQIESFMVSNINWKRVREIGKLDYSDEKIIRDTRPRKEAV